MRFMFIHVYSHPASFAHFAGFYKEACIIPTKLREGHQQAQCTQWLRKKSDPVNEDEPEPVGSCWLLLALLEEYKRQQEI